MKAKFFITNTTGMLLVLFSSLVVPACHKSAGQQQFYSALENENYSVPIPADSANLMIKSYLDGIDYTNNTNEIRSFVCNADSLRVYLSNPDIKNIKLLFAHNMAWINSGHEGQRPGPNDNAITIIIAGLDDNQNYVSYPTRDSDMQAESLVVLDRIAPCPYDCMGDDLVE